MASHAVHPQYEGLDGEPAVFCGDPATMRRITSVVGERILDVTNWEQLRRVAWRTPCVVIYHDPFEADIGRFRRFKTSQPYCPVVLITPRNVDVLYSIRDLVIEEIVWSENLEKELPAAMRRAARARWLEHIAEEILRTDRLPARLKRALASAYRQRPPFTSVEELACTTGCDRRTLWRQWARVTGESNGSRLKDFVDALVLFHAITMKVPGRSWSAVAYALRMNPRTLSRVAKRVTGRTLKAAAAEGAAGVARRVVELGLGSFVAPVDGPKLSNVETDRP